MRQLWAVTALGNIADENTVTVLLKGLTAWLNVVNQHATRGLSRVEAADLCERMNRNSHSDYPIVRWKVARCLFYYSQDEQIVELMTEIAANDPRDKIRIATNLALGQLNHMQIIYAKYTHCNVKYFIA